MTSDEIVNAHRAFLQSRTIDRVDATLSYTRGRQDGLREALDHLQWCEEATGDEGLDEAPS